MIYFRYIMRYDDIFLDIYYEIWYILDIKWEMMIYFKYIIWDMIYFIYIMIIWDKMIYIRYIMRNDFEYGVKVILRECYIDIKLKLMLFVIKIEIFVEIIKLRDSCL